MIKDIITHNESARPDADIQQRLHADFPQCFNNEGKFDIDKFSSLLKDNVSVINEGYDLNFLGKSYAKLLSTIDTTTIIKPDLEHNSKPENANSENIYISGDNLDALKHLLKSYAGRIKCIYIDPPYNTGTDGFVYNDNFTFSAEELESKLSISSDQAIKILDLTKRGSASHSAWLMFMMPRLQLAKDLLTDDGVIFISIDDNEQANLKILCDGIWGEENIVCIFPRVTKKGGKSSNETAKNHDYVLMYTNNREEADLTGVQHTDKGYCNKDEFYEKRGYYKANQTLDYDSLGYVQTLDYPIVIDNITYYAGGSLDDYQKRQQGEHGRADWGWRWSKGLFDFGMENGFIEVHKGRNGSRDRIYTKTYQNAKIIKSNGTYKVEITDRTKPLSTLEFTDNQYSNDNAKKALDAIMEKGVFEYTKPPQLISRLSQLVNNNEDAIFLDFFSGSASSAQAIMQLNIPVGRRKFIMVQIPDKCSETSEAYRAGYKTIDEIGMERIIRVGRKIKNDNPLFSGDLGFKHYSLYEPTETTLDTLEKFSPKELFANDSILNEFGKESVLETWCVKDGYGFGAKIDTIQLGSYSAYHCGFHLYFINPSLSEDDVVALIDKFNKEGSFNPNKVVIFGYSFTFSQTEMLRKNLTVLKDSKNLPINIEIRY
ncbi:MAG: site-specific DNA-methyltransferase [Eubacteriales bacterium]|nr:site-specific DNA-methyltransferase [Eubacteriales bacterium]MDD4476356.1 site-specific DNA-methyltransferase [Eubacteriales bacterium]